MKQVSRRVGSWLRSPAWVIVAILLVAGFLWAATAREVYQATSPRSLVAHVWFRKAYSLIAFAIVGWIAAHALRRVRYFPRVWLSAGLVGTYSALIEVAQKLHGSTESWRWNLFDIACGLIGGLIGALAYRTSDDH